MIDDILLSEKEDFGITDEGEDEETNSYGMNYNQNFIYFMTRLNKYQICHDKS